MRHSLALQCFALLFLATACAPRPGATGVTGIDFATAELVDLTHAQPSVSEVV